MNNISIYILSIVVTVGLNFLEGSDPTIKSILFVILLVLTVIYAAKFDNRKIALNVGLTIIGLFVFTRQTIDELWGFEVQTDEGDLISDTIIFLASYIEMIFYSLVPITVWLIFKSFRIGQRTNLSFSTLQILTLIGSYVLIYIVFPFTYYAKSVGSEFPFLLLSLLIVFIIFIIGLIGLIFSEKKFSNGNLGFIVTVTIPVVYLIVRLNQ